jgi:hypothetical protein
MARGLVIENLSDGLLHLLGADNIRRTIVDFGVVEPIMGRRNPMEGRMRWKDGSLLNNQQVTDENYQIKNRIS